LNRRYAGRHSPTSASPAYRDPFTLPHA
jgi:hypothetical protein